MMKIKLPGGTEFRIKNDGGNLCFSFRRPTNGTWCYMDAEEARAIATALNEAADEYDENNRRSAERIASVQSIV